MGLKVNKENEKKKLNDYAFDYQITVKLLFQKTSAFIGKQSENDN